jgi:GNAT superfamily N-acetyltransferase
LWDKSSDKKYKMEIERFKIEDAEKASGLINRCLKEVNSKDYEKRIIDNLCEYYSKDNLIDISKDTEFYVLKEDDKILGTAGLHKKLICGVFVDPKYHKKGYGRKLMKKLERLAWDNGHCGTILYSSLTAVGFYEHLGYDEMGESLDDEFGKNIIMRKLLD